MCKKEHKEKADRAFKKISLPVVAGGKPAVAHDGMDDIEGIGDGGEVF